MQNNVLKRLQVQDNEENIIDDLIELEFGEFCIISDIDIDDAARYLFDIAIYSYLLSNKKNQAKLLKLADSLRINFKDINLSKYNKYFE